MPVKKTGNHQSVADKCKAAVKAKPARAAALIERALIVNAKERDAMVKSMDDDKEWREHIVVIGACTGAPLPPDFTQQVKRLKAPGAQYSAVNGKYGAVSKELVEKFCNAETNVTEDKISDACDSAAGRQGQSGVKELTGHAKYKAELKITGASKRLYATKDKKGAKYTFDVLAKHT